MTAIEKVIRRFHNGKLHIDKDTLVRLLNTDVLLMDLNGDVSTFYPTKLLVQTDPSFDGSTLTKINSEDITEFYVYRDKDRRYITSTIHIFVNNIGVIHVNAFDYIVFSRSLTMEEFLEVKDNIDTMIDIDEIINNSLKKSFTTQNGLQFLKLRENKINRLSEILKMNDNLSEDIKLLIRLQTW
jgi:hypothetical protein